jgi:hypothetical protein
MWPDVTLLMRPARHPSAPAALLGLDILKLRSAISWLRFVATARGLVLCELLTQVRNEALDAHSTLWLQVA